MIHRAKPCPQRQLGRGENGPRNRRGLATTFRALKQTPRLDHAMRPATTDRARKPVAPPHRDNHGTALLFRAIQSIKFSFAQPALKLHRIPSHLLPPLTPQCSGFATHGKRLNKVGNQERFYESGTEVFGRRCPRLAFTEVFAMLFSKSGSILTYTLGVINGHMPMIWFRVR
jgi:hypothetical protein